MCGSDSGTPLHSAAYWGLSHGVRRIMQDLGADPNLCNARGLPPIYEACAHIHGPSNKEGSGFRSFRQPQKSRQKLACAEDFNRISIEVQLFRERFRCQETIMALVEGVGP